MLRSMYCAVLDVVDFLCSSESCTMPYCGSGGVVAPRRATTTSCVSAAVPGSLNPYVTQPTATAQAYAGDGPNNPHNDHYLHLNDLDHMLCLPLKS